MAAYFFRVFRAFRGFSFMNGIPELRRDSFRRYTLDKSMRVMHS